MFYVKNTEIPLLPKKYLILRHAVSTNPKLNLIDVYNSFKMTA